MTTAEEATVTGRKGCTGDGCGARDPWPLLNVRHRGVFCCLCTSCVLKYHLGHFCCSCFALLDFSPPSEAADRAVVHCSKCPSVSHLACLPDPGLAVPHFICPSCNNPGAFSYFPFSSAAQAPGKASNEKSRVIDETSAKVLLLAANLAAASMRKAAAAFKAEAERKVKEAIVARKRAREMLEKVISLSKEKERANGVEALVKAMPAVPASELVEPKKKMPRLTDMGVVTAVATQKKGQNRERVKSTRFHEIPLVQKPAQGAAERVKGASVTRVGSDVCIDPKERVVIVPRIPKQVLFEEKKEITMAYQSKIIKEEERQVLDVADKISGMPQIVGDGSILKNDPMVIFPASVSTESLPS